MRDTVLRVIYQWNSYDFMNVIIVFVCMDHFSIGILTDQKSTICSCWKKPC